MVGDIDLISCIIINYVYFDLNKEEMKMITYYNKNKNKNKFDTVVNLFMYDFGIAMKYPTEIRYRSRGMVEMLYTNDNRYVCDSESFGICFQSS